MWAALLALLIPFYAYAVNEADLPRLYPQSIAPYYAQGASSEFAGVDGVPIRYKVFEASDEKGAIVLLPGRTEFMLKYAELIYDLRHAGYSIYILDHRGQGLSGRMTKDPQIGDVRDFQDYVDDLNTFMRDVVSATPHSKIFLLAHSMGSAIGVAYAIQHPQAFAAMALVSPMFQINTGKYSELEAYLLTVAKSLIGQGKRYAPGRGDDEWKQDFADNLVTHSEIRYHLTQQQIADHLQLAVSGPSCRWVREAIEIGWYIRQNARKLSVPILILQGGQDQVVITSVNNEVCSRAAACQIEVLAGARHEILMEQDPIRDRATSSILSFVSRY